MSSLCIRRRLAAAIAVAFCGYLTLATSAIPEPPCPEEAISLERTFTHEERSTTSRWQLTAVTDAPILRWHIAVEPAVKLTYFAPQGSDVPVVDAADVSTLDASTSTSSLETLTWATHSDASTDVVSKSSDAMLPADHLIAGIGRLTLVCGGNPALCDDVKFAVAVEHGAPPEFTLTAEAVLDSCASKGTLADLRLEREAETP